MVRSFLSVKTKNDYTAPVSNGLYRFWQEDDMRLIANVRLITRFYGNIITIIIIVPRVGI